MIVYRLVKGSPLTITELDDNFHDVDDRINAIETNPAEARSIDEITAVGSSLIILYTDSTEDTVPIPVMTLRGRGTWASFTAYLPNDIVTANSVIYLVLFAHTSVATFDAGENDGMGHDYYAELFPIPELSLPPGGATGYVLSKVSDSDFDMEWQARGIPDGGASGTVLTKLTSDDRDVDWVAPATLSIDDLSDVDLGTASDGPAEGEVLTFVSGVWTNGAGASELAGLSDVAIGSDLAADDVLTWTGSEWTNAVPAGGASDFASLDDVTITTPARGDMLARIGTDWVNIKAVELPLLDSGNKTGSFTLDMEFHETVRIAITGNATISSVLWPASNSNQVIHRILRVQNTGAFTLAFPGTWKWPAATAPTLTAGPNKSDLFQLYSFDDGSTIFAIVLAQNFTSTS